MPRGCASRQAPGVRNGCGFEEKEKMVSRAEPCRALPWASAPGMNACKDAWLQPELKTQSKRRPGRSRAVEQGKPVGMPALGSQSWCTRITPPFHAYALRTHCGYRCGIPCSPLLTLLLWVCQRLGHLQESRAEEG